MDHVLHLSAALSRRDFLRAATQSVVTLPLATPLLYWGPEAVDVSLVLLELEGGNDGLNTLIPVDDAAYAKARPQLGSVRHGAHRVRDGFALHPALGQLAAAFARGEAAAVHSVGYPQPDRSHFFSRDVWHTAEVTPEGVRAARSGWLGRAADALAASSGAPVPALALGSLTLPLALRGERVVVPVLSRLEDYALHGVRGGEVAGAEREDLRTASAAGSDDDDLHAFVRGVAERALADADALRNALAAYRPRAEFPAGPLGEALQLASRVLVSGFGTRLLHVPFPGFDTHAQQLPTHADLLRQLDQGLAALLADLTAHGRLAHTVICVHSEFGRRVAENGSLGTDHGAAAPVFVLGGGVREGLHGRAPDLRDLDDGDVRASTDFRAVYAALLARMGLPPEQVLRQEIAPVSLFS
jgi:uncharacterized protein (DUF1501 family)